MSLILLLAALQAPSPEPGSLQVSSATFSVSAAGGSVTIPVTRTVGSSGAVGCSYETVNGTAIAGTDYVAKTGTLSWANAETANKNISITILNNTLVNKVFMVRLHSPTGGAWLGLPPSTTNHEGRTLGSLPAIGGPLLWNTTQADAVMSALQLMPANNPWNEDISQRPVDPNSDLMITFLGSSTRLALNRDMNFVIVPAAQATKVVPLDPDYVDESDPGPYPIPDGTPIEGWDIDDTRSLANSQLNNPVILGDRHGSLLDAVNGKIFEFWELRRDGSFNWSATNEATFNFRTNTLRPDTYTSADAAGLPILPSIPRYDECARGMVEHALRVTFSSTRGSYVYPATHKTSSHTEAFRPRMGERFRLKNSTRVNNLIAAMSPHPKAIALALKKYGMFVADNGGNWRMSAGSDGRLADLDELTDFIGDDFEVIVPTGPNEGPRAYSSTVVTVTAPGGGGGDTTAPAISILTPTTLPTFSTSATPFALTGSASDNVAVTQVSWVTDRGQAGLAGGTLTAWTASIPLQTGQNAVTVTAQDAAGNSSAAVLTVDYTPPPPAAGGGGGGGGGGCGLLGIEFALLFLLRRRCIKT